MASFWDNIGPGLLQAGGNAFLAREANKAAEEKLKLSQGPLYDAQNALAQSSLTQAGTANPQAFAAERFKAQQALVEPGNEAARLDLMRKLQRNGMLGMASHAPVAGTVSTPGVAMNPMMASLLAAQEGAKAQASYGSLREGEQYLDNLLRRGQSGAASASALRNSNIQANNNVPAKPSIANMLFSGVLNDPKTRGMLWEGAQKIPDWLRGLQAPAPWRGAGDMDFPTMQLGLSDDDWGF